MYPHVAPFDFITRTTVVIKIIYLHCQYSRQTNTTNNPTSCCGQYTVLTTCVRVKYFLYMNSHVTPLNYVTREIVVTKTFQLSLSTLRTDRRATTDQPHKTHLKLGLLQGGEVDGLRVRQVRDGEVCWGGGEQKVLRQPPTRPRLTPHPHLPHPAPYDRAVGGGLRFTCE